MMARIQLARKSLNFVILCYPKFQRPFAIRFEGAKCTTNNSFVSHINCSISKVKKQQEGINIDLQFAEDYHKPSLDILILMRRISEPDFVLVNATQIDGCSFFENRNLFQMLKIIRDNLDTFSTEFPNKCPIKKNSVMQVKGWYLKADDLPTYVPECKFTVKFKFWSSTKPIIRMVVNGSVESKYKLNIKG